MILTTICSLESARRKFFMNPTQNMCKNLESNVFVLRKPKSALVIIVWCMLFVNFQLDFLLEVILL